MKSFRDTLWVMFRAHRQSYQWRQKLFTGSGHHHPCACSRGWGYFGEFREVHWPLAWRTWYNSGHCLLVTVGVDFL